MHIFFPLFIFLQLNWDIIDMQYNTHNLMSFATYIYNYETISTLKIMNTSLSPQSVLVFLYNLYFPL